MGVEKIKIRELKRKDRVILSGMIKKLADKIGNSSLLNIIKSNIKQAASVDVSEDEDGTEKLGVYIELGLEILKMLIDTLEEDTSAWFADLLGCTVEELDNMPVDVEIQIIQQIVEAKEASDFFTGALQLFSKTKEFAGRFTNKKN